MDGENGRKLEPDGIVALEKQRDTFVARTKEAARDRAVARANRHTAAEADRLATVVVQDGDSTRVALGAALQPLTALVSGDDSPNVDVQLILFVGKSLCCSRRPVY